MNWASAREEADETQIILELGACSQAQINITLSSYSWMFYRSITKCARQHTKMKREKNITNWKTIREFRIYWNVLWNWEWSCARSGNGIHVDLSGGEAANGKIWFDQTHLSLRCHTSVDKMQSSLYQISFAITFFFQKKEFIRSFVLFVFVTAAWSARTHPI